MLRLVAVSGTTPKGGMLESWQPTAAQAPA